MGTLSFCDLPKSMQIVLSKNKLLPCSTAEIDQIEKRIRFSLPKSYKDFLKIMGHGADNFWRGEDCFYQHLFQIQVWARDLLQENNFPEVLPEDAFVFFMHQGYQFSFFKLSEGDSSPIYSYCEGQEEPYFVKTHSCFREFFAVEVDLYLKYAMFSTNQPE